jgi:CheY-like chemotaxis protein
VTVVDNGKKAVRAVDSERFDLVLMDVQMPHMDGLEATVAIRQREKQTGRHVPIVAMTAHAIKGDRQRCLEAGMNEYVSKPVRSSVLFSTIESVIGASAETAAEAEPAALEAEQAQPSTAGSPQPQDDPIDWDAALETFEGNHDLLNLTTEVFLDEYPKLLAAVREAVAGGDPAEVTRTAHTLKGSLRYFGPSRAFDQAYRLETTGDSGALDRCGKLLEALDTELRQVAQAVERYVRQNSPALDR